MKINANISLLTAVIAMLLTACSKNRETDATSFADHHEVSVSASVMNANGLSVQTRADMGDISTDPFTFGEAVPDDYEDGANESVAPYTVYTQTTPTTDMPLFAAIWASSISHQYTGVQSYNTNAAAYRAYVENGYVDYHNTTKFTSGVKQLLDHQLFYPDANAQGYTDGTGTGIHEWSQQDRTGLAKSPIYFIGLCPRSESGWSVKSDGTGMKDNVAYHTFDGKEDVMYAPEVSKNITETQTTAALTFHHLLTWIRIRLCAETPEAIASWGKVESIRIKSKDQVFIDTSKRLDEEGAVTFAESKANNTIPTYKITNGVYTKNEFSYTGENAGVGLTLSPNELCYVLCAPKNAVATAGQSEYEMYIDTSLKKNVLVTVDLKGEDGNNFSGNTAGHQFTVLVTFKLGFNISTVATVSSWENGGLALTNITED